MKKVQMERRDCCEGIGCVLAGRNRPLLEKARVGKELKSQLVPMVRQVAKEGASEDLEDPGGSGRKRTASRCLHFT